MPASGKMLKQKEYAANRKAGIGDETGRLPSRVKPTEVMARCTICGTEIRVTKKNIEIRQHFDQRHPTSTFEICFPTVQDPNKVVQEDAATATASTTTTDAPKKKKTEDLSFLDASLNTGKKK